ncbi:hypothetical protein JOF56_009501 [Kibdelosporangium banguiense]|uniref:Uncharacterized protein n=1 Tax=Kibdelosporangium banguiense TaxID=1365924 RepID=A0ABS4TXI3_9PSEU|nr:hypothetical protein [Kibdelosporangium banguiense]
MAQTGHMGPAEGRAGRAFAVTGDCAVPLSLSPGPRNDAHGSLWTAEFPNRGARSGDGENRRAKCRFEPQRTRRRRLPAPRSIGSTPSEVLRAASPSHCRPTRPDTS